VSRNMCIQHTLQSSSIQLSLIEPPPRSTLFPYTTLFRSLRPPAGGSAAYRPALRPPLRPSPPARRPPRGPRRGRRRPPRRRRGRSEEHTSELQSRFDLVCRLLLEKKNKDQPPVGTAEIIQ